MDEVLIREVAEADTHEWYLLRIKLWPDLPDHEHTQQMEGYYSALSENPE
jgi:hypothetical protein